MPALARRRSSSRPPLPVPEVLLSATPVADVVRVPARHTVSIEGAGAPESPAFQEAIGALYGISYGLKFARKDGGAPFAIGPLEGRWWADGVPVGVFQAPRDSWRWRLRIAVPPDVTVSEVKAVARAAREKKGGKLAGSSAALDVYLERIPAARMGRVLHVGPYGDEATSFERMDEAVKAAGLRRAPPHVEVYLSDPRRTAPAKLRTVLLGELAPVAQS